MSTLRVDSIQDTTGTDNQGKILQVAHNTTPTTRYSATVTTFTDTGFSVTITPKFANSKIRIDLSTTLLASSHYCYVNIYRNGTTSLGMSNGDGILGGVSYYTTYWQNAAAPVFDSPNTTSAVTYNLYAKTVSGTITLGWSTSAIYPNCVYLTATEIAQ
jgi:hypothetical protein